MLTLGEVPCPHNFVDKATGMNACGHPEAGVTVGRYPTVGVCEMCIKGGGGPTRLFASSKRNAAPVVPRRKKILCQFLGEMLEKGSCACGDGDMFVCLNPAAFIDGRPQTTLRRSCALCKYNESAGEEEPIPSAKA